MRVKGNICGCARKSAAAAFTLIELMIVCAIIGAVLTIAIPTIYRYFHPESLEGTVRNLIEACSHARANAILSGNPFELVIRPGDRSFSVTQAAADSSINQVSGPARLESKSVSGEDWRMEERNSSGTTSSGGGIFSARISEKIMIDMIDVNFVECKDADAAHVRFYPNGTSDEFTIVLHGDNDQWRKISLEVVTGLPDLSSDPSRWVKR